MKLFRWGKKQTTSEQQGKRQTIPNNSALITDGVSILFSKQKSIDRICDMNEYQDKLTIPQKLSVLTMAFDRLRESYPEHTEHIDKQKEFELDLFSEYINGDIIADAIEDIEKLNLTPELAANKLKEAKSKGIYLGKDYSYYANIAGQPYEIQMIKELEDLPVSMVFEWQRKQEKEGRYYSSKVYKLVKDLENRHVEETKRLAEEYQVAFESEQSGEIEKAINLYETIAESPAAPYATFQRLVILYRKQKDYNKEISVCERYIGFNKNQFEKTDYFKQRLARAKHLQQKHLEK